MAISTSPSSLHFISLSSKTLSFSKPTSLISLSLPPSSHKSLFPKLFSKPNWSKASAKPISSRLFRNVSAVSAGFDLDDDDVSNDSDEFGEENFPPEQKFFVGNLPFSADSGTLAGLFGQAGTVELAEVIYDKVTGRSRGFGFVTMSSIEEVEAAVQQFNGYELDGRALRVNSGPPPRKEESPFRSGPRDGGRGGGRSFDNTNRVYVGNLAWSVDNLALETLFREQGNVLDAKVVYDRDSGRSRGFGFVTYSTADEVNGAIESLNGVDLDGRQIRVSAAEAPPPRRF